MADVTTKIFLEEFEVMVDIGIHDFEINNPQRVCISVEVLLDLLLSRVPGYVYMLEILNLGS